jgi:hypothetical protein
LLGYWTWLCIYYYYYYYYYLLALYLSGLENHLLHHLRWSQWALRSNEYLCIWHKSILHCCLTRYQAIHHLTDWESNGLWPGLEIGWLSLVESCQAAFALGYWMHLPTWSRHSFPFPSRWSKGPFICNSISIYLHWFSRHISSTSEDTLDVMFESTTNNIFWTW